MRAVHGGTRRSIVSFVSLLLLFPRVKTWRPQFRRCLLKLLLASSQKNSKKLPIEHEYSKKISTYDTLLWVNSFCGSQPPGGRSLCRKSLLGTEASVGQAGGNRFAWFLSAFKLFSMSFHVFSWFSMVFNGFGWFLEGFLMFFWWFFVIFHVLSFFFDGFLMVCSWFLVVLMVFVSHQVWGPATRVSVFFFCDSREPLVSTHHHKGRLSFLIGLCLIGLDAKRAVHGTKCSLLDKAFKTGGLVHVEQILMVVVVVFNLVGTFFGMERPRLSGVGRVEGWHDQWPLPLHCSTWDDSSTRHFEGNFRPQIDFTGG